MSTQLLEMYKNLRQFVQNLILCHLEDAKLARTFYICDIGMKTNTLNYTILYIFDVQAPVVNKLIFILSAPANYCATKAKVS